MGAGYPSLQWESGGPIMLGTPFALQSGGGVPLIVVGEGEGRPIILGDPFPTRWGERGTPRNSGREKDL